MRLRFKGCHLSLWNWLGRTKEEMEAKYMEQVVAEPVEVDLPDPALSPTSKLLQNNKRTEVGTLTELQQEIKRYEACSNPGRDANVLDFWKLYQADLPNLARIARIVLAIPASSSKSERVFSTGGRVVSSMRFLLFYFFFYTSFKTPIGALCIAIHDTKIHAHCFRGRLNPRKVEALMVLCENEELVEDFMKHSEYKVQKSAHNAFDAVKVEAVAGEEMAEEDLESLQFYLEDLEMQDEEGVEEEQE